MKYINKKTQAVIETACVISGGDRVVIESQLKKATEKPKKKVNKKSGE